MSLTPVPACETQRQTSDVLWSPSLSKLVDKNPQSSNILIYQAAFLYKVQSREESNSSCPFPSILPRFHFWAILTNHLSFSRGFIIPRSCTHMSSHTSLLSLIQSWSECVGSLSLPLPEGFSEAGTHNSHSLPQRTRTHTHTYSLSISHQVKHPLLCTSSNPPTHTHTLRFDTTKLHTLNS